MDFSIRADLPELLDQPDIAASDIQRNLYELSVINHQLGGHAITLEGFFSLAKKETHIHVCEIGCGGGDNLKQIEKKAVRKNIDLTITGIDINSECINVAKKLSWDSPSRFIVSDYRKVEFSSKPDIIYSSLFCHHFKDAELVTMFRWMRSNSRSGFFINDLHRNPVAYHAIRFLTRLFSRSYLVKHDAPVSVLRGFKKKELKDLFKSSGISNYTIRWKWAFRWLIIVRS